MTSVTYSGNNTIHQVAWLCEFKNENKCENRGFRLKKENNGVQSWPPDKKNIKPQNPITMFKNNDYKM
jgi:hypothetical protein